MLHQSAGRTDIDALTALDTGRIREAAVLRRRDNGSESTVFKSEDAKAVRILAARHTASAQNTLAGVADQAGSQTVNRDLRVGARKCLVSCAGQLRDVQKLAVTVLLALLAVLVVVGKKKLNAPAAGFHRLRGGDADLHALADRIDAAGDQPARAGSLDKTDTAGALIALTVVEGAKRRDLIAAGSGGLKDCQTFLYLIFNSFYFDIQHYLCTSRYRFSMALNLHVLMQAPHFTHCAASIFNDGFLWPGAV